MTHNYLNKHAETRTRIAQGARRQLYSYILDNEQASASAFRMNQIMLGKNGKVRVDRLRKGPSVYSSTYTDNAAFSAMAYHSTSQRKRNAEDTERFDDEGLFIVIDAVNRKRAQEVFITHHAILRAFERGLWVFKDHDPSYWVKMFIKSAIHNYYESSVKYNGSDKDTFVVEADLLNSVVQRSGRMAVILTFTPPTKKA